MPQLPSLPRLEPLTPQSPRSTALSRGLTLPVTPSPPVGRSCLFSTEAVTPAPRLRAPAMEAPAPSPTSSSPSLRKPHGHQVTQGGRAPPVGIEPQPRLPRQALLQEAEVVLPCWGGPLQRVLGGWPVHLGGLWRAGSCTEVGSASSLGRGCGFCWGVAPLMCQRLSCWPHCAQAPSSPTPARFGPVGRVTTWEEHPLPRPPGPLEAWAHVFLSRRRRAARGPWVGG